MFKSVVWASTIDYPEQVATVLFVGNCNMSCEYCHNANLKDSKSIDFESEILPRLLDRKDFVDHVVISGGECTCYASLPPVIKTLVDNGFKVGIHTNGTNPNMLLGIIDNISFVGMDIKCSDYIKHLHFSDIELMHVYQSIELIIKSSIAYEFRTTLYPPYFESANDVVRIAKMLKDFGIKEYVLQEYSNEFDKSLIEPFRKSYILEIVGKCNKIINTKLKGHIE